MKLPALAGAAALCIPCSAQWSADLLSEEQAPLTVTSVESRALHEESSAPDGLSLGDWSSIRAAHEANRHAALPVEDGHEARNPGQRWRARFDGRGFTTVPDAKDWIWGLELVRWGYPGEERTARVPAAVCAEGQRVIYEWDPNLSEWWVNDRRGLEHGYTVYRRPERGTRATGGPLSFTLAVRGALRAEAQDDGRSVRFVDQDGAAVLTYTGLVVLDADRQELPARIECVPAGLRIRIDEDGARYPLTIDPVVQQARLLASNRQNHDQFGWRVAASGDTVVVGASGEDSGATGVNGDQYDNSAEASGAAYVFVRDGTTWSQQAYLKASNTDSWDSFGTALGISVDTIVVGARHEDSRATGVDGDDSDDSADSAGAAYVFARSGTTWSLQAYLKASNTDAGDHFGKAVSVSGDTIVVGAQSEDSNATGVDGDQGDNSLSNAGAAYVFVRSGTNWSQQAYIKASNTGTPDHVGTAVSVSGDTIVVGAYGEASNAGGVNGDQSDNSLIQAGAAYVFVRDGTTWSQEAYLKASNPDAVDFFGDSVSVSGDTILVGAYREDSNATGVNGDQADNSVVNSGAAYVFVRNGTTWGQQAYLKASNTGFSDWFGVSVAVSGKTAVVGAHWEDSAATGVDGDDADNSATDAGAAYVFTRSGTTWSQAAYLKSDNTNPNDLFGYSVSASGDKLIVGVHGDNSPGQGWSGAAYVFDASSPPIGTSYCGPATPNSTGSPGILSARGSPLATSNDVTLTAGQLPHGQFGYFLAGRTQGFFSPPGSQGFVCLTGNIGRYNQLAHLIQGPTGSLRLDLGSIPVNPPSAVLPGDTWNFQCWYRDAIPGPTSNFTDAVSLTFETSGQPAVQFPVTLLSQVEETVQLSVTVTLSQASSQDVTVPYTTGGTATYNVDWRVEELNPIVIPAGEISYEMTIIVAEDNAQEGDETGVVTLGAPTGGVLGTATEFTLTIVDDD